MELRTKGILSVTMFCMALLLGPHGPEDMKVGRLLLFLIFIALGMFFLASAKNDRSQMGATDRIRKVIRGMGYSSNDVERLTMKTVSVLMEEYAHRPSGSKPLKIANDVPDGIATGMKAMEASGKIADMAFAASKWTYFTQSELAAAIQTSATLLNIAPPQS